MLNSRKSIQRLNQKGQSLIEYTFLLIMVSLVGLAATQSLGRVVKNKLRQVKERVNRVEVPNLDQD